MSVTFSAIGLLPGTDEDGDWAPNELDVNMSNSNAATVCAALGLDLNELDWCGTLPAEDFLGRILVALAVSPVDAGVPVHEVPGPGARFIECGRPEGYTQQRLGQLRELADWAVANKATVTFG
jgi:hypothetical protein